MIGVSVFRGICENDLWLKAADGCNYFSQVGFILGEESICQTQVFSDFHL
jgi:hypothetical protein